MNIRYRVNAYDEQRLFNEHLDLDTNAVARSSHVQLGSLDNIIHLSSYAVKLSKDIHLQDLQNLLTKFLRLNRVLGIGDSGVSSLRVHVLPVCLLAKCSHSHRWFPVMHCGLRTTARRQQQRKRTSSMSQPLGVGRGHDMTMLSCKALGHRD